MSSPPASPPSSSPWRVNVAAVVAGVGADLGITAVASLVATIALMLSGAVVLPGKPEIEQLVEQLLTYRETYRLIGVLGTGAGGLVAGRYAGFAPVRHGLLVGALGGVVTLAGSRIDPELEAELGLTGTRTIDILLGIAAAALAARVSGEHPSAESLRSTDLAARLRGLWSLFGRPTHYFASTRLEKMDSVTFVIAWIGGFAWALPDFDIGGTTRAGWARAFVAAPLWALYAYWVGGWWFGIRLRWAGRADRSKPVARRAFVHSLFVLAVPVLALAAVPAHDDLTLFAVSTLMVGAWLWSLNVDRIAAIQLFSVRRRAASAWFFLLPFTLGVVLFSLGVVAEYYRAEREELETPIDWQAEEYAEYSAAIQYGVDLHEAGRLDDLASAVIAPDLPEDLGAEERLLVASAKTLRPDLDPESTTPEASLQVAVALPAVGIALAHLADGEADDALRLARAAVTLLEEAGPAGQEHLSGALQAVAEIERQTDRFEHSLASSRRALAQAEAMAGPDGAKTASAASGLGLALFERGHYEEALAHHARALRILVREEGPDSPAVASVLYNQALAQENLGREDDAEISYRRALEIDRTNHGDEHAAIASSLEGLSNLLRRKGDMEEAVEAAAEAVEISERVLGPNDRKLATALTALGHSTAAAGRWDEARPFFERAANIHEKAHGPNHTLVAENRELQAAFMADDGELEAAIEHQRRVVAIREAAQGPNHPQLARSLNFLGRLLESNGEAQEGRGMFDRAIAIQKASFGPSHPRLASSLARLAVTRSVAGEHVEALELIRRAVAAAGTRGSSHLEDGASREVHLAHVGILYDAARAGVIDNDAAVQEGFVAAQRGAPSRAAYAEVQRWVRSLADANEQELIREYQDKRKEVAALHEALHRRSIVLGNIPDSLPENDRLEKARAELGRLEEDVFHAHPAYERMLRRDPLPLRAAQGRLRENEAIAAYFVGPDVVHLFVVRHDRAVLGRSHSDSTWIKNRVDRVLRSTDGAGIANPEDVASVPFDFGAAAGLHDVLLRGAEASGILDGVENLLVVQDGFLGKLPFGMLVTEEIAEPLELSEYRNAPWLIRRYSLTTLPSILAVETRIRPGKAAVRFLGIGDPLLDGPAPRANRPSPDPSRGAEPADLRRLARLPSTATELVRMARAHGRSTVLLQEEATEARLKRLDLEDVAVLAFATHALSESNDGASGLVLTPPEVASDEDDGLLTPAEVEELRLNGSLVILSGCHTAAGAGRSGEALSGLAEAFLYAGASALVVSHWPVASDSASELMASMFEALSDEEPRPARALQRAMLALLTNADQPAYMAHPMFWAPFVLVGHLRQDASANPSVRLALEEHPLPSEATLYHAMINDELRDLVALWPAGRALDRGDGIPEDAVVGTFYPLPEGGTPHFADAARFSLLLQTVVALHGAQEENLFELEDGRVAVVDLRAFESEEDGRISSEDVFGFFESHEGRIDPSSYVPNPDYRMFTDRGFFKLPPQLHGYLVATIWSRND